MGEMAEYYSNDEVFNELKEEAFSKWRTKDNKLISIQDMTVEHINNCLNMLKTGKFQMSDKWINTWINLFEEELKRR